MNFMKGYCIKKGGDGYGLQLNGICEDDRKNYSPIKLQKEGKK